MKWALQWMMTCGLQQSNQSDHCCIEGLYEAKASASEEGVLGLVQGSVDGILVLEVELEDRRRFGS